MGKDASITVSDLKAGTFDFTDGRGLKSPWRWDAEHKVFIATGGSGGGDLAYFFKKEQILVAKSGAIWVKK